MQIRKFQQMMKTLYFKRDQQRGVAKTYNWLIEEVDELGEALKARTYNKKALEEEFADVIAWLASLANIIDIDLEGAATAKYKNRCPKCNVSPCECNFI